MLLFTSWLANSRDSELSFAFAKMVRERVSDEPFHVQDTEVHTTLRASIRRETGCVASIGIRIVLALGLSANLPTALVYSWAMK